MRLSLKAIVPTAVNKAGCLWWVEDNNPFCARSEKDEAQLPPAPKTSGDLQPAVFPDRCLFEESGFEGVCMRVT